ncbi:hypothetical protein [Streptomyces sp. NPDC101249]|uniref:hypothetical protein n=1 Tax=Streptomyces sp. NPDC101249 TaxID=3366140 RepID=UPI003825CD24
MAFRAVVVGPDRYAADSGVESHPSIGISAQQYGEVLAADAMWGPGSCRVLGEDEVRTAEGVMSALEEVAAAVGPEDTLMVVYVGHGQYWSDLPGGQVHFAVGSSHRARPWTWLSSWYVYRALRRSRARLKVLIADCCYSNMLPQLGGDEPDLPGVLGTRDEGTCVFTAVRNEQSYAWAEGCAALPGELARCTPFSGHLLNVLRRGTRDYDHRLTIGLLREAVQTEMERCEGGDHQAPRMALNDAREGTALFTNHMEASRRVKAPPLLEAPADWARALLLDRDSRLHELLRDEYATGAVVALLTSRRDEASRNLARHINARANDLFTAPDAFARYWSQAEKALRV